MSADLLRSIAAIRDCLGPESLHKFQQSETPRRWSLTSLSETHLPRFQALFQQAFGHPISQALWRWKYAEGRGCAIVAWRDQRLVAHYGGMRRRVLAFGQPVEALQVGDAMVDPAERAVMTKSGVMFQCTAAFLELYQGLAEVPLAFGFPNHRAMGLGERLGLYAEVGSLVELRWPAGTMRPRLTTRLRSLEPSRRSHRAAVAHLWVDMAEDLADGIVGVRDWAWIKHRYLAHPEHRYDLLFVESRLTGQPLGLLVMRRHEDTLELVDLIGPLRQIPALVVQARQVAARLKFKELFCWITQQHADRFISSDTRVVDLGIRVPTNAWVPQPLSPAQLRDRWWLMSGDTDFH